MKWWMLNSAMLNSPKVQRLGHKEFREKLNAALGGEENEFSDFLRGPYVRPPANEWRALRAEVFKRDDYTCQYCGERGVKLECDHIVPVAKGGGSEMGNLATACFPCNRSKRSRTLEEWRGRQ